MAEGFGKLLARNARGEEFAVLRCGAPQPLGSTALARRISAVLGEPFDLGVHLEQIGVSIGIAIAPFDRENLNTLLKSADLVMYRAKADCRGRAGHCAVRCRLGRQPWRGSHCGRHRDPGAT